MSRPELRILQNGIKEWYLNNRLHRENGPARIRPDGIEEWYLNGRRHRENGPATTCPNYGIEEYWVNGEKHRLDGPAIIWGDGVWGDDIKEYWLNNKEYSFNEYKSWFINKISNPSYQLTEGDIDFIKEYLK